MMADDEQPPMRGGKMLARDAWFGLSTKDRFQEFRRWWHRSEKRGYGRDLMNREEAIQIYEEWQRMNPPRQER